MGPSKGSFGITPLTDFNFGLQTPELDISNEKRIRNLSKTKQWKEAVDYIRERQAMYRLYLPGYNPLMHANGTNAQWETADCIIRELDGLVSYIEGIAGATTTK